MIKRNYKSDSGDPRAGQGMIEYILVFVAVVVVIMVAVGPGGMFTGAIEESIDTGVSGIDCMAHAICYDPNGCPPPPSGCP